MVHSHVWRDLCTCAAEFIHVCNTTHVKVHLAFHLWHTHNGLYESYISVDFHVRHTHGCLCHTHKFMCATQERDRTPLYAQTYLLHMSGATHLHISIWFTSYTYDSLIWVARLIHTYEYDSRHTHMTHSYEWRDSFTHMNMNHVTHILLTHVVGTTHSLI